MTDDSQRVKEFYDDDAATYDRRFKTDTVNRDNTVHQQIAQSFIESLKPDARTFELGCGTGRLTATTVANSISVSATDISRAMLEQTQESVSDEALLDVVQADATDLPYRKDCFDAGIMINVLSHLPNPQAGLKEIGRILGNNGQILFNYPKMVSLYFPVGAYVNAQDRSIHSDVYTHWYTETEIDRLLTTAGLQSVERFGHVHAPRRNIPVVTPVLKRLDRASRQSSLRELAPIQFVIAEVE